MSTDRTSLQKTDPSAEKFRGQYLSSPVDKPAVQADKARTAAFLQFVGSKIEGHMAVNFLRDRSLAVERWTRENPGQGRPTADMFPPEKFRESLIDRVYERYLECKAKGLQLGAAELDELEAIASKLAAIAEKMERFKDSKDRGLDPYMSLDDFLAREFSLPKEEVRKKIRQEEIQKKTEEYYLSECSVSPDDLKAWKEYSAAYTAGFPTGPLSNRPATNTALRLARQAMTLTPRDNWCLGKVNEAVSALGLPTFRGDSAKEAIQSLGENSQYYDVRVMTPGEAIQSARPGDICFYRCLAKGGGEFVYGHTGIVGTDGLMHSSQTTEICAWHGDWNVYVVTPKDRV